MLEGLINMKPTRILPKIAGRSMRSCYILVQGKATSLTWRPSSQMWLRKAGCECLTFGIESGNEGILRGMKKGTSLKMIREGTPSYLMLMDGMIEAVPNNERLLIAAAQGYSSFAVVGGRLYTQGHKAARSHTRH
jgi:hypothetical protein